ncbi:MAG TPA: VWA domain-containing protein [Polyangia bacterium]|nr:VWA domain-containing protein [Polyangia bacterium]
MDQLPPAVDHVSALLRGITLAHPAALLLLLVIPVLALVGRHSLADFGSGQRAWQTAARAVVLAAVALALAGPELHRPTNGVSLVIAADVSDSIGDEGLAIERRALDEAAAAAAARGDPPPRVVQFAAEPQELMAGAPLERMGAGGQATDIALALGLAAGLADSSAVPRLLILSDGLATRGDLLRAATRLGERGMSVDALALQPPRQADAAIAELTAPEQVSAREPFRVDVRLASDRATTAQVTLQGGPNVTVDDPRRSVALAAGATTVGFRVRVAEPGTIGLEARVAAPGDRRPANDQGFLAIATAAEPRVLCLEGEPHAATSFARALGTQRIATDVSPPGAVSGAALARYDLVVLADVPRAGLNDSLVGALASFVRAGGGLLVAGGTQSFGPGGYAHGPLEALLPVRLDVPEVEEEPALALALVIDRSGSMTGPKLDLTKQAARATADAMAASDQIAVIAFDNQATPVVPLQAAANRQRIARDIGRIAAAGGTNILSGLREAVDELLPAHARKKHVILLSDGQSPYDEIPDLLDGATAARISVSAIGVGDGADQTMLKMIAARGGGRFYQTRDPASIPRIFSRETSDLGDRAIVERPTRPRVEKPIAALAGTGVEGAPPLGGYVTTRRRAQAETVLTAPDGAPLLARWPVGLGQVMAWTSDLGARWGAAWTRWPGYDKLWAQLARAAMRRRATNHFPIAVARAGDRVRLVVDAIGPDDRFMRGLDGELAVTELGGAEGRPQPERTVSMSETAPGRYEATVPPGVESGSLLFTATLRSQGTPVADADGRLALPPAPELMPRPAGDQEGAATLAAAAGADGGRVVTNAGESLDPRGAERQSHLPLQRPLLLAAALLFIADVALRRIRVGAIDSRR